jgi:hypothetical protein
VNSPDQWPALAKDDEALKKELEQVLAARELGDPYRDDGDFARNIASLPQRPKAVVAILHGGCLGCHPARR